MNLPPSAAAPPPSSSAPRRNWPHLLANSAVTLAVLAVAAATFVLSYAGVHAIALQGGISVQLARIYPGLFDAVLVIACVAAVVLRDGRWWARGWAWLIVIVMLGAIGTTDVLHAMNYALRHRPTEGVVAAAPVVAVLLAFSLLLTMLRRTRSRASDAPTGARGRTARRAARQQPAAPAVASPIDATPIDATRVDLVPFDAVPFDAVPFDAVPFDAVPVVAAGAVPRPPALAPRPPAPPAALPAAPAAEVRGEPEADADQATDRSAAIEETQEIPVLADHAGDASDADEAGEAGEAAQDVPGPAADGPNPPTEPDDAVAAGEPPSADVAEPSAEGQAAEPSPEPSQAPRPAPQAIRYASSAAAEDWESEVDPDLAGQVYPVLSSDPDIDTSDYTDEPQDIDDTDAPPFATAPFASVPRLNRMRVTPIPPTDSDDEDQG
jgi:hypothetical protein